MVVVMHLQELLQYKQHTLLDYLAAVRILTRVMATLIMPITLSTGRSFFLAASGIKDQILISTQRSFFDNNVLIDSLF